MKYVAVTVLISFSTFFIVNSQLCMTLNDTNLEEIWQKYKVKEFKIYLKCLFVKYSILFVGKTQKKLSRTYRRT